MLSLSTSATITSYITLFLGYLLAIGPMGFINAWIGKVVGDTTAEDEGLLTLDPLVHIDPLGFICLLLSGLGWSKMKPIQIGYITEPWYRLKVFFALFGETFFAIIFALITLIILIIVGAHSVDLVADPSSIGIAIATVLFRTIFIFLFMGIARFIYGIIVVTILLLSKRYQQYAAFLSEISFFVALGLTVFLARYLQMLCLIGILSLCTLFGYQI